MVEQLLEKFSKSIEILIQMGDYLDGIDNVMEENFAGFNRYDKGAWPHVRGNSYKMYQLLYKYRRQLEGRFGELATQTFDQKPPEAIAMAISTLDKDAMAVSGVDLGESFNAYIQVHRENGFRWDAAHKQWVISLGKLQLDRYLEALGQIEVRFVGNMEVIREKAKMWRGVTESVARFTTVTVTRLADGKFSFTFPYSDKLNYIFSNKSGVLSGITEYDPQNHARETYSIELVMEAIEKIQELLPDWTIKKIGVDEAWEARQNEINELRVPIPAVAAHLDSKFQLFPYQNEMVRFIESAGGRAIVGDEMGLGKTIQTLAWAVSTGVKSVLVVCPKVVRRTWIQEAKKFFPAYYTTENTLEISPKLIKAKKQDLFVDGIPKLATINYESLHKILPLLKMAQFELLIIDESHRIKNPNTATCQEVYEAAEHSKYRLLLSGTAIKNKKSELFTQVELVRPGLFQSANELLMSTIGGAWNKLQCCYLARQKSKVLKDLPEKIHSIQNVVVDGIQEIPMPESFEEIAAVKSAIALAKVKSTIEFVKEILNDSDSNCLVFTDSVEAAKTIAGSLGTKALLHHGQMSDEAREAAKVEFQREDSPKRVFVSTRQSLAVGATLTRADKVVFNDLCWTVADMNQAEDRVHRVGQKNTVNIYWIVADNHPWDRYVAKILARKQDLCKKMNQGQQLTEIEREFMNEAITVPEKRHENRRASKL